MKRFDEGISAIFRGETQNSGKNHIWVPAKCLHFVGRGRTAQKAMFSPLGGNELKGHVLPIAPTRILRGIALPKRKDYIPV